MPKIGYFLPPIDPHYEVYEDPHISRQEASRPPMVIRLEILLFPSNMRPGIITVQRSPLPRKVRRSPDHTG